MLLNGCGQPRSITQSFYSPKSRCGCNAACVATQYLVSLHRLHYRRQSVLCYNKDRRTAQLYSCNNILASFVSCVVQHACLLAKGEPTRVGSSTVAEPSVDIIRRAQAGEPDALTQLILSQQHYV